MRDVIQTVTVPTDRGGEVNVIDDEDRPFVWITGRDGRCVGVVDADHLETLRDALTAVIERFPTTDEAMWVALGLWAVMHGVTEPRRGAGVKGPTTTTACGTSPAGGSRGGGGLADSVIENSGSWEIVGPARPFDEARLREDIVSIWGPAGAHVDVYDHVLKLARESHSGRRSWASIAGDLWNQLENLRHLWEGTEHESMVQMYIDEYERKDGIRA